MISDLIDKEIMAASIMYNKYIVNAIEVIDDPNSEYLYIIIELCDGEISSFDYFT